MEKFNGMKVWFTSDLHFFHKNIVKYCNRPFNDTEDMNNTLIKRWNALIKEDDVVFVLGDFCFGGYDKWVSILKQLNGKIHLIQGNHDPDNVVNRLLNENYLESVSLMKLIEIDGQKLFLCHYPMISWPNEERGSYMIHGHVHSLEDKESFSPAHYDVGVDHNSWFPVSYVELKERIIIQND